ncbi:transglutaminaseTgpA domain-containing protein [Glutamicibacter sp.]|uniref:transglutaminase family protein n=1 Tax=Glutamicibacter sp. TaxID=1931995 RepID=UPI0028BE4F53|nr:transglutaminaseTgpA domain-containing protein [Glutamicibacter sp.]
MSTITREPDRQQSPDPQDAPRPQPPVAHHLMARAIAALCLALAVLAGFASITGVIEGLAWFPALLLPVIGIHLCAGLLRGIWGLRWAALPAAVLIAFTALMQHPAMQSTGYSVTGMQWFMAVLSEAALQFSTQVPPVAYSRYVAFVILLLALVVSLLIEVLATFKKLALLITIPLCFAPIIASLFKQEGAGIGYLALVVAGILGFSALHPYLYRGTSAEHHSHFPSRKQLGFLGATSAACIAAMLAASMWVPGFRQGMFPEGQRPSGDLLASNVDPLLNLGRDLRSNSGAPVLRYYTSADHAPYLRTAVIEDLNTTRWEPNEALPRDTYFGDTAVESDFTTFNSREEVALLDYSAGISSPVLPLPNRSYLVEGIIGNWDWTPETSVARLSGDAVAQTKQVAVAYSELDLSPKMAQSLEFYGGIRDDTPTDIYRSLPEDPEGTLTAALDQGLKEAYAQAKASRSDLEKAVAIQDYLRSARFIYSERTPLREGYDGANKRVVEAFLERRQGYCVHFASAMALMAREAGIPSRIAVGYAPGKATGTTVKADDVQQSSSINTQLNPTSELTEYTVSGKQAHAWPELYLGALGWIPFEPTPSQGQVPSYAPEKSEKPEAAAPTINEVPTNRSTGRPEDQGAAETQDETAPEAQPDGSFTGWWAAGVALIALGAGLSVAPLRRRRLKQQRRQVASQAGAAAASALWMELQAAGADALTPADANETVNGYTRRLAAKFEPCATELELLGAVIQDSFYAGRHPSTGQMPELLGSLDRATHQMHRSLPIRQRVAAALFPASLRRAALRRVPDGEQINA